jgi:hypothetical protein
MNWKRWLLVGGTVYIVCAMSMLTWAFSYGWHTVTWQSDTASAMFLGPMVVGGSALIVMLFKMLWEELGK